MPSQKRGGERKEGPQRKKSRRWTSTKHDYLSSFPHPFWFQHDGRHSSADQPVQLSQICPHSTVAVAIWKVAVAVALGTGEAVQQGNRFEKVGHVKWEGSLWAGFGWALQGNRLIYYCGYGLLVVLSFSSLIYLCVWCPLYCLALTLWEHWLSGCGILQQCLHVMLVCPSVTMHDYLVIFSFQIPILLLV